MNKSIAVIAIVASLALAGCTAQDKSEPISAKPTASASPKATKAPTVPNGTRALPYHAGTKALLSTGSVFTIGFQPSNLNANEVVMGENQFNKIVDGSTAVLGPVTVSISEGGGQDLSAGVVLFGNLIFEYVTAAGRAYGDGGTTSCGVIPAQVYDVGTLYVGAAADFNVCAQVPTAEIPGGLWSVSNGNNEKLFFTTA